MTKKAKPKPRPTARGVGEPASKSYEKVIANWTKVLGISTVALVFATAISAYFLYETDLTLARTAERQIRAYVLVEPEAVARKGKYIVVQLTGRNVGQTPAYRVLNRGLGGVFDYPFKQGRIPISFATRPMTGTLASGPIQTTNTLGTDRTHAFLIEAEFAEAEVPDDKRLLVVGAAYYTDIFGKPRYTRFCFFLKELVAGLAVQCHEHNDAN
jgi:hypothetical protein